MGASTATTTATVFSAPSNLNPRESHPLARVIRPIPTKKGPMMSAESMKRRGLTLSPAESGAHYRIARALKASGMTEGASRIAASTIVTAARCA